ncbi:MAG: hypothetical protein GJ676_10620 [Rhodobacteraceae bacterium]|nr:hypothetical protein [Paracoccaceae bacterium]
MLRLIFLPLTLLGLWLPSLASAHFNLNQNVRILHVVHEEGGLSIYMRTPMPYLVAEQVGPLGPDGIPVPAPLTTNRMENGLLMHLVDWTALQADPLMLGKLAADALVLSTEGHVLPVEIKAVRVAPIGVEPGFASQAEAVQALTIRQVYPATGNEIYVGDAVVDLHLWVPSPSPVQTYQLEMTNNPGLEGQDETANLILNYQDDDVRTYRAQGLLLEPITVSGSPVAAASTFLIEGIRHIPEGLDHVLFVLCMIIGAASLRSLIGRVTGFTMATQ